MNLAGGWNRFWFSEGRAEDLALARILFGICLVYVGLEFPYPHWSEVPTAFTALSARFFFDLGLPGLDSRQLLCVRVLWWVGVIGLTLGVFPRASALLACVSSLFFFGFGAAEIGGRSKAPIVFVTGILAASRCGDALSVGAWVRRRRAPSGPPEPLRAPAEYFWPRQLVCAYLSYIFFAAAVSKIHDGGLVGWILTGPTKYVLVENHYKPMLVDSWVPIGPMMLQLADRLHVLEGFTVLAGACVLSAELLYPTALFFRPARIVLGTFVVSFLVTVLLEGHSFAALIGMHAFWVPWSRVVDRIREWRPQRESKPRRR